MKAIITGGAGFVGSALAAALRNLRPDLELLAVDSLVRPGSEGNRARLRSAGIRSATPTSGSRATSTHSPRRLGDRRRRERQRHRGLGEGNGSRQLVEHNLSGTVNLLEYCKRHKAGFLLLSTSRVYSIPPLAALPVVPKDGAYVPDAGGVPSPRPLRGRRHGGVLHRPARLPLRRHEAGLEQLALEYGHAFGFPVVIDRCGNLAGAGQFGRPDQGILAFWINAHLRKRPLRYIGFDGLGHQVRDFLHPDDLADLVAAQLAAPGPGPSLQNVSGGAERSLSLRRITAWCDARFGPHPAATDPSPRPFDIPWMILDSGAARRRWNWEPKWSADAICAEIAAHAEQNPGWLELSQG